jgi:RNA polymerase sigma factor (sigma-70 family)
METGKPKATAQILHRFIASIASRRTDGVADAQLVERFVASRAEARETALVADRAFEELVARHGAAVRGVCRRLLDDPGDIEDTFQATFLVLFRRASSLSVGESLGPWLCGVARRIARRARADRARRQVRDGRADRRLGRDPSADVCRAEIRSVVDEEIARLPEHYRSVVALCLLDGLTYEQAAERLNCPVSTVGVRLARGRKMLKTQLRRRGIVPASAALGLAPVASPELVGRLARTGFAAPRVADLARREIATMFAMKAGLAAGILSLALLAGGAACFAGKRDSGTAELETGPTTVAQAEPNVPLGADGELPPGVKAIVERHEAQLERIRSLQCVIEMRASDDAEKSWKTMSRWNVYRSGPNERVRGQTFWTRDRARIVPSQGYSDVLLAPDGIRSLRGLDPDHPPIEPITALDELASGGQRVSGMIHPAQPSGPWGYKGGLAADYMALFLPTPVHSLRELCQATPGAVAKERSDEHGNALVDLNLKSPDGKVAYVVTLSPARGYAIAETKSRQATNGTELKSSNRVLEFQEPAPGIFLPKSVRQTMSWAPAIVIDTVFQNVAVNAAVPEKEFALRFPAGLQVFDGGRKCWYLWGRGAPQRTYRTADEINEWNRIRLVSAPVPPGSISGSESVAPLLRPDFRATEQFYMALSLELEAKVKLYERSLREAKSDAERQDIVHRLRPEAAVFVARYLDMAKRDPDAPASLQGLTRAVLLNGSGEAVEILKKNWAAKPEVASVVLAVGLAPTNPTETESFLKEVLARNPNRDAKGRAAYALASLLYSVADNQRWHAEKVSEAGNVEQDDRKRGATQLLHEADELMRRVETEFADVKLRADRPKDTLTLGNAARNWLQRGDGLVLGQPAPAIEGKDTNGQPVRLSDYRGKVVVVTFWASWCAPCMKLLPEEEALARRLADKPFVHLGINCDYTSASARKAITERALTWPNVYDGVPSEGKIAERYEVAGHGIPAIFVIDQQGVLRHKWVSSADELGRAVDAMLAAGGAKSK